MNWINSVFSFETQTVPIGLAGLIIAALMVTNLWIAGRTGWAWWTFSLAAQTAKLIIRLIAGIVREIAQGHEGSGHWDEE